MVLLADEVEPAVGVVSERHVVVVAVSGAVIDGHC